MTGSTRPFHAMRRLEELDDAGVQAVVGGHDPRLVFMLEVPDDLALAGVFRGGAMGAPTHCVIAEVAWLPLHRLRRRNDCGDHRPDRAWQLGVPLGNFARRGDCATALVAKHD